MPTLSEAGVRKQCYPLLGKPNLDNSNTGCREKFFDSFKSSDRFKALSPGERERRLERCKR